MDLFGEVERVTKGRCAKGKRCNKCGKYKPLWDYSRASAAKDGLRTTCKECDAASQKRSREKIVYISVERKQCSDCGLMKPINQFGTDKTSKYHHRSYCLDCMRLRSSRTKPTNKNKLRRREIE